MRRDNIITAIDLGSDKCVTLIGQINPENQNLRVVGVSAVPSQGMRRSVIVDLEKVLNTIHESLDAAERMAGFDVSSCYVSVSGYHIKSKNSQGVVAVANPEGEITHEDKERVIEAARAVSLPQDREIIHVIPREFKVDSQEGIRDPVGMTGVRLEAEAHIITGMTTTMKNIEKCINDLGLVIDGFVFSGLASSEVVLTETEKELGVVALDIGAGSSNFSVFTEGAIAYSDAIPIGARHITQDVALGCRISLENAEKLKLALSKMPEDRIKPRAGESKRDFNKRKKKLDKIDPEKLGIHELSEPLSRKFVTKGIIYPRLREIIEAVGEKLEDKGLFPDIPAGFVICGGGAETIGIVDITKNMLRLPARVGIPEQMEGLVSDIKKPAYATSIGLLKYGYQYGLNFESGPNLQFNIGDIISFQKIIDYIKKIFKSVR